MWSSRSLRSRAPRRRSPRGSFPAGRSGSGSQSSSTRTGLSFGLRGAAVDRDVLAGEPGHVARKYGSPQATVTPSPAGVGSYRCVELAERRAPARAWASARSPFRSPDVDGRGDELVVERRHDDLDVVVLDDPHALEQVLLGRQAVGRRAGRRPGRAGRRARRCRPRRAPAPPPPATSCLRVSASSVRGRHEDERAHHPVQVRDDPREGVAAARRAR